MPVISIWGIPKSDEETLISIYEDTCDAVLKVKELGLERKSITVRFLPDMMVHGLGEEIIIDVTKLFAKPERTTEVRNRLAQNLGEALKLRYPEALVECSIDPLYPSQGFWTSSTTPGSDTAAELKYADKRISDMDISVTAFENLKSRGVHTVRNLLQKTEEELIVKARLRKKDLRAINEQLKALDPSFRFGLLTGQSEDKEQRSLAERITEFEENCITEALAEHDGDIGRAAAELKIGISSLKRKMRKYKIG